MNLQIGNLDIYIQNYQNDLIEIKNNFEISIEEYENKLHFKEIEILKIKEDYEKEKYDVIKINKFIIFIYFLFRLN